MKILLLGANSYVGARLYSELKKHHEVVGTFHRNKISDDLVSLDVTDKQAVLELIAREKPKVIVHSANNGSRKWCDEHPEEAVALNQEATKYIVEGADAAGAKVVYISSFAAIAPSDLYGNLKRKSEEITKTAREGYLIIQPGIVIGFSPKTKKEDGFFSALMDNVYDEKPAEYDMTRQFQPTHLGHISEVLTLLFQGNIWGKTLPVAAPDLKTKYELAKDILSPFGITVQGIEGDQPVSGRKKQEMAELKELGLPVYTYEDVIRKTVEEIKHRERFALEPKLK